MATAATQLTAFDIIDNDREGVPMAGGVQRLVSIARGKMEAHYARSRAQHLQIGRTSAFESHGTASIRTTGLPGEKIIAAAAACPLVRLWSIGLGHQLRAGLVGGKVFPGAVGNSIAPFNVEP